MINTNNLTVILHFQNHIFFLPLLTYRVTCLTHFVLQSSENKLEPLRLRDPPVIKAGICYAVQEADGICFSCGESVVGLVCSLTQEQQMFFPPVVPLLLLPYREKKKERTVTDVVTLHVSVVLSGLSSQGLS